MDTRKNSDIESSSPIDTPAVAEQVAPRSRCRRLVTSTNLQVLLAAVLAAVFGLLAPHAAAAMKPLADLFVSLITLVIAPIVFLVVVTGIATAGGMRTAGRIAIKALIYFEVVTTIGMLIGLLAVNVLRPGDGITPPTGGSDKVSAYTGGTDVSNSLSSFISEIVPKNAVDAFATGNIIQVLIFAILFAIAVVKLPATVAEPIMHGCQSLTTIFFRMIRIIMRLAPLGTFGAVAYTVGKYGPETLTALAKLVLVSVLALLVFVVVVLGIVTRLAGISLVRLVHQLRHELYVVLGTSSSESVLPQLMARLEGFGCARRVVGLVVPTGYSFNLDGVAVVVPICVVFIAQVYGIPLSLGAQLGLFLVILLVSKGTAGVTGSAFITLAGVVAATNLVPVAGLALVLSVDRFLSLSRAFVNVLGNAVAAVVVAKWEPGGLDVELARQNIGRSRARVTATIGDTETGVLSRDTVTTNTAERTTDANY
jgi:aerobic C4-dicarboxylate transport protein